MAVVRANIHDLLELCDGVITEEELPKYLDHIGAPLDEREGDTLFIEVTPDRPDYLSVEGIAYGLLCYVGNQPDIELELEPSGYKIEVENVSTRPYIAALVAKNVRLTEEGIKTLMQFQDKIHETFGRKRKKVAVGVHDLKNIVGKNLKYKTTTGEDKFIPLNESKEISLADVLRDTEKGVEFAHLIINGEYPVVMDEKDIISFPPILNSDRTKVLAESTDYLVEITGTDKESVMNTARIMALMFQMRGGIVKTVEIDYGNEKINSPDLNPKRIEFSPDFIKKILGMKFSEEEIKNLLKKVSIEVAPYSSEAIYPAWRVDIMDETDIAEEVAIAYGYNNFEPEKPELFTIGKSGVTYENMISEVLVGLGFREVKTFVISNEKEEFDMLGIERPKEYIQLENPLTVEHTMLRTSLIPSMLRTIAQNKKYKLPLKLFEIGECSDGKGKTIKKLVVGMYGPDIGYEEISGVVARIMERLGKEFKGVEIKRPYYIEGRAAKITETGELGEIHPKVLEKYKLEYPTGIFEIELNEL